MSRCDFSDTASANPGSLACNKASLMRDVIIELVKNIPALLSAFAAVVRLGEDDDRRLEQLETVVADLQAKLSFIHDEIAKRKIERNT